MKARATQKPTKPGPCNPSAVPEPFGTLRRKAERLKALHAGRFPTLLPGPTGCGKTTLIEWLVADLVLPQHEVVIGSREMLPADLVGRWHLGAGGSEILDFAAPHPLGYPRETVVAEKFEAMTKLGLLNSRMKDFYDLWVLSRRFGFDGVTLATAIRRTFAQRKTAVVAQPTALTPTFGGDATKQTQWQGFLRKSRLDDVPTSLQSVIDDLVFFLVPVAEAVETVSAFNIVWTAPGPWEPSRAES
jgi:hypothetical protein